MGSLFISYRQENDAQLQRVRAFAEELSPVLSPHGWDVILDQLQRAKGPDQGWAKWSADQVRKSDRVLMVVTTEYVGCMLRDEPEPTGLGAAWESRAIYHELHRVSGITGKYRALTFQGDPRVLLPAEVGDMPCFITPTHLAGILDWLDLTAPAASTAPTVLTWPPERHDFAHDLADRRDEFLFYQAMLAGKTRERIMLLQAASNHGKSGLIREFTEYAEGHLASAAADLKGCADSASLHRELRAELLRAGLAVVHGAQNLSALLDAVETAAQTRPIVLLLDTYEQAVPEVQKFLEGHLLAAVRRAPGLCVVIGGQSVPDMEKALWGKFARHFPLAALGDARHWIPWAKERYPQLSSEHVTALAFSCQGIPANIAAVLKTFAATLPPPPASS